MSRADASLQIQLDELQEWLRGLPAARDAPPWSRMLLTEDRLIDWQSGAGNLPRLSKAALRTPEEFEQRWVELVTEGRTSWINLSAQGVWTDALVVVAETSARGELGRFSPDEISVNFSGPSEGFDWSLERRMELI